ncbi:SPOR domain-containing protein [Fluviicola sp.]|uniref:SPOR domain-containing protein n=1 Tax=Fluviicola sp. TaxID=1917219 RepID=UPI0031D8E289
MNNYLLQLLREVKTLIIPGLGALTVTNEATGEILFMPYLKFDDGTLANHIAEKEKIEKNEASNMISRFVREVTAELDKGNSYDMYQFGRFVKVDGEIAFEAWSSAATEQKPAEAPKQEAVVEKPVTPAVEPVKPEPKVEIPPVVEETKKTETALPKAEEPKNQEIIPPVVETPANPVKEEPKKPIETTPKAEQPKVEKIVPPVVETPKKEEPKKEPVKPAAKKDPVKEPKAPKEKKKTSVFAYILWGFLVLILGAGTFIAIQFDSLKKDFPILADLAGENDDVAKGSEDVKQLEEDADANADSGTEAEPIPEDQVQIVEDQLPAEKPVKEPKKTVTLAPKKETPAPKPTPKPKVEVTVNKKPVSKPKPQNTGSTASFDGSKHFHIIAGSFGSEANANRLAAKLQSKGFAEASVTMNSGMYRVSVKGFATLNEATAEAANIQGSVPGAWVLKM